MLVLSLTSIFAVLVNRFVCLLDDWGVGIRVFVFMIYLFCFTWCMCLHVHMFGVLLFLFPLSELGFMLWG
jgi:hypothetical protein